MFCKHCGSQIGEGAQFCPNCGKSISGNVQEYHLATAGRRFVNLLLDNLFSYVFVFALIFTVSLLLQPNEDAVGVYILYFLAFPLFHIFFESIWQRTPAKFITGTKVVNFDGTKPTFGVIVLRTLIRYIPFEPVSFFFSDAGWHDRWSKTLVVPATYTQENVAAIDVQKKSSNGAKTAIVIIACVLFGLAFIGILSSVVLVSLNSAREKSRDARRMADIRQMQTALELYYNDAGGYPGYDFVKYGKIICGSDEYLNPVPINPTPGGIDYIYNFTGTGNRPLNDSCEKAQNIYDSYSIAFSLESDEETQYATPEGISKIKPDYSVFVEPGPDNTPPKIEKYCPIFGTFDTKPNEGFVCVDIGDWSGYLDSTNSVPITGKVGGDIKSITIDGKRVYWDENKEIYQRINLFIYGGLNRYKVVVEDEAGNVSNGFVETVAERN